MSWRWALCGVGLFAATSVALGACAQGQDGIDLGLGGNSDPDGGTESGGSRLPVGDSGGGGGNNGSAPDSSTPEGCPAPSGCSGKVLINELMARGSGSSAASQEFVELYNPNSCAVSLGGWKLAYRSKTGTGNTVLHPFGAGDSIAAGAFLVLGTASFSAKKDADMVVGMADEGQVGLVDDGDTLVDAVGYGATTGPFIEGTSTVAAPPNGSVGRSTCGVDTDDNAADFKAYAQHSAGAPNP